MCYQFHGALCLLTSNHMLYIICLSCSTFLIFAIVFKMLESVDGEFKGSPGPLLCFLSYLCIFL